ncbi:MAG: IMPACT family protein [Aquincola tertiaricarbonis]|uniref:IMPACT family protein n=1 Tax=Aquincola tertiaricarbonis TaxID=391953 RepID=UPI000614AD87|nr:YigZ family protein [Aquincola tertiaricarbonis]
MAFTLAAPVSSELVIKKSRFIGCVEPMRDRPGALQRVAELRAMHPAAAHVCWALLAGGDSAANDDGEPGGTAGRPMLEVLRHQELEGVLATVVRYFGGVKLGAGGLVRAYTDAVAQALLSAQRVRLERLAALQCTVPYAMEGALRRELEAAQATLGEVSHGMEVTLAFTVTEPAVQALRQRIEDLTQGRVRWAQPGPGGAHDTA